MEIRTNLLWVLVAGLLLLPASAQPASAQDEGIKVHGDWVIEVRNPDGSLASRLEFQNALTTTGGNLLGRVLARAWVPSIWSVQTDGVNHPCQDNTNPRPCALVEASAPPSSFPQAQFNTLTLAPMPAGDWMATVPSPLRLSGSFTAARAGDISRVHTGLTACSGTVAPAVGCGQNYSGVVVFTNRALPSPVLVSAGQTVQISVTISFS